MSVCLYQCVSLCITTDDLSKDSFVVMDDDSRASWMERPRTSVKFDVKDTDVQHHSEVCSVSYSRSNNKLYFWFLFWDEWGELIPDSSHTSLTNCQSSANRVLQLIREQFSTSINTICSGICFQWAVSAIAAEELDVYD